MPQQTLAVFAPNDYINIQYQEGGAAKTATLTHETPGIFEKCEFVLDVAKVVRCFGVCFEGMQPNLNMKLDCSVNENGVIKNIVLLDQKCTLDPITVTTLLPPYGFLTLSFYKNTSGDLGFYTITLDGLNAIYYYTYYDKTFFTLKTEGTSTAQILVKQGDYSDTITASPEGVTFSLDPPTDLYFKALGSGFNHWVIDETRYDTQEVGPLSFEPNLRHILKANYSQGGVSPIAIAIPIFIIGAIAYIYYAGVRH